VDKAEARHVLAQELSPYRSRSYSDLVKSVGATSVVQVHGPSGTEYQVEIEVMWDPPRDKSVIRVLGAIDDGRLPGALTPLCDSVIVAPDGTFVGE
jgi:hypothetical protein